MAQVYKIEEGSLHDKFQKSRAKIQMFAGGFGNGKTTGAVVKGLQLARDYPGSNGLIARSTYPKLSQTIRKEVRKWCPKAWIKRDVDSKENLIQLTNGSTINFSHVMQTGKGSESSTSNLLSATYDWIIFDQIEDPEVTHKDFLDLLGRLRGQTLYVGDDPTMPSTGPRWFIIMCNPTRNWVYKKLVKPLHDYMNGIKNSDLLVDDDGKPIIEIFEGSTYDNAANLPEDFIATMESTYKGQMKDRFLKGEWGAYEGLVYSVYDPTIHQINHDVMVDYFDLQLLQGARLNIHEAYDHGLAQPACYLLSFTNLVGDVFVMDGFYEKELTIKQISKKIKDARKEYGIYEGSELSPVDVSDLKVLADPAIFRRNTARSDVVGTTTSGLFRDEGVVMERGNNDIINGIAKVQSYLYIDEYHRHPIYTDRVGAPRIYFSSKLEFIDNEIVDYFWKKDTSGEYEDIPNDKNDHAMDAIKYLLSRRPRVATFRLNRKQNPIPNKYRRWREAPDNVQTLTRSKRYG